MSHSSILGANRAPTQPPGHDSAALGPSDSSDSGSDIAGELDFEEGEQELADLHRPSHARYDTLHESSLAADSDADGTGERASAVTEHVREAGDILPDRIIGGMSDEGLSGTDLLEPPAAQDWVDEEEDGGEDEDEGLDESP